MRGFKRLVRLILPVVFLIAALVVYLVDVKPMAHLNKERQAALNAQENEFESLVDERSFYPTTELLDRLLRLEEQTDTALQQLIPAAPQTEEYQNQVKYIFMGWGYSQSHPAYLDVERLRVDAARRMGKGMEESADFLAKAIAISFCRAEIGRFENLTVIPAEEEFLPGRERLGYFDVELAFNSGITESIQFVEEVILTSGGGFLIHPLQCAIKRLDPGQWLDGIKNFSGPPVRLELKVRVIYSLGKGRS